jgi:FKBP-type peptidyl-prolyl cis-trans isomerase FklB
MTVKRYLCVAPLLAAFAVQAQEAGGMSDQQKFSYAIGMQIGASLARQGVEVDPDAFAQAVRDVSSGSATKLTAEEADKVVKQQQVTLIKARADKNAQAGEAYRTAYKQKEGAKAFDNGIVYRVLKEGTGTKPTINDTVEVNYVGKFINGNEFDSSTKNGGPVSFPLQGIIKGWQETLVQMPEGSKWEIVVPPELAYGMQGSGPIGPNETLVFSIELVKVAPTAKN